MGLRQFASKQFLPEEYKPKHFDGGTRSVAGCDGVYYANKSDIEIIFGSDNVTKWADLNNSSDQTEIDARICWSLQQAHSQINDRLTPGPYKIPFETPVPIQIIDTCARLAGVILYESRGITDMTDGEKPKNQLTYHRQLAMKLLNNILNDRVQFLGLKHTADYPEPVVEIINRYM